MNVTQWRGWIRDIRAYADQNGRPLEANHLKTIRGLEEACVWIEAHTRDNRHENAKRQQLMEVTGYLRQFVSQNSPVDPSLQRREYFRAADEALTRYYVFLQGE